MKWWWLLIVVVFITSCGPPTNPLPPNYFEGRDGLVMQVQENSPPDRVYSDYTFPISLRIENMGAFDVVDSMHAQASVSYDPLYFTEDEQTMAAIGEERENIQLYGKSPFWPSGQIQLFTVGFLSANRLHPRKQVEVPILVSLCYPYKTKLTTQVCVDADPARVDERSQVCHAEDLFFTDQGAPVAVTQVKFESLPVGSQEYTVSSETPVTDNQGNLIGTLPETTTERVVLIRPVFRITIENVGDGQVVRGRNFGVQQLCGEAEEQFPAGSVVVRGRLGGGNLTCMPDHSLAPDGHALGRMADGKIEVLCMVPNDQLLEVRTNYFDILQIEVAYSYRLRETLQVEITDAASDFTQASPINIQCSNLNRNEEGCKSFAGTHNCAWCDESQSCVNQDSCGAHCDDANLYDRISRECVKPCPTTPPSVALVQPQGSTTVELRCTDPSVPGEQVDNWRCGCDRQELWFRFLNNRTADCPDVYEQAEDVEYNNNRQTVATIPIPTGAQKVCGFARDRSGHDSRTATLVLRQ